ncbi:hypothetical protein ECG_07314 [Echinococcus granulosus]|uniref:MATH domain-containing protein n=1 Tax=Echinococcus granulosus TaxID=6210 RepID=A0A068WWH4_ECHGR|nr:hypothetical protein ECG_07314 [Echinococcus granulosus]CDS21996.1 hypothetical protein EgrG_000068200 [Echinococcus granulosus]
MEAVGDDDADADEEPSQHLPLPILSILKSGVESSNESDLRWYQSAAQFTTGGEQWSVHFTWRTQKAIDRDYKAWRLRLRRLWTIYRSTTTLPNLPFQ